MTNSTDFPENVSWPIQNFFVVAFSNVDCACRKGMISRALLFLDH